MKARVSSQPRQWTSANLRVVPTGLKNKNHNRLKIIIIPPTGKKIFLQLEDRHAYELANSIVDAMESQDRSGNAP